MNASRETRWLNEQEQQIWAQLSTMILRLQPVLSAQLQREFGISHFEYLIMALLSEAAGSDCRAIRSESIWGGRQPAISDWGPGAA